MAATAQMTRPQQEQGNWTNIFPPEQVNETQSALFVKKLLAVAVSNITYLRAIFPEHAFGDRCLEDLNLKILRDDSSCPGACQVIKWVKGCFDALEKKFLKVLVIGIYTNPEDPDTIIESYTFKFSYERGAGTNVDVYKNDKHNKSFTAAETKKDTIRLLRTIVVLTQSLSSLPDNVMMTMKLLYYDEVTPVDYEPPGFTATDSDQFHFEEEPMNIKVGDVQTPFHTVKLRIKTDGHQFQKVDDDVEGEQGEVEDPTAEHDRITDPGLDEEQDEVVEPIGDQTKESISQVVPGPKEGDIPSIDTPRKPKSPQDEAIDRAGSQFGGSQISALNSQEDLGVKCPCGHDEDDGLMVLCAGCRHWQHGVCFKIVMEEEAPARHICNKCAKENDPDFYPTDPELKGMDLVEAQAACLWRRALFACTEMTRVLPTNFSRRLGVENNVGTGLINRLVKEGFLKNSTKGKKVGKVVDVDKLKEGIAIYFKRSENQAPESQQKNVDSPMNVELEIIDKKGGKKKAGERRSKDVDMEIDALSTRADEITLDGHRKKKEDAGGDAQKMINERGRGKKRVKAMTESSEEFEISNSQAEVSQDIDYSKPDPRGQRKRQRKASQVRNAILV